MSRDILCLPHAQQKSKNIKAKVQVITFEKPPSGLEIYNKNSD